MQNGQKSTRFISQIDRKTHANKTNSGYNLKAKTTKIIAKKKAKQKLKRSTTTTCALFKCCCCVVVVAFVACQLLLLLLLLLLHFLLSQFKMLFTACTAQKTRFHTQSAKIFSIANDKRQAK